MQFDDYSIYDYTQPEWIYDNMDLQPGATVLLNVGWLGKDCTFPTQRDQPKIREQCLDVAAKLESIGFPTWTLMRGVHECDLDGCCENRPAGNGMFVIKSKKNDECSSVICFVAPAMIIHYIRQHHYIPPQAFIEAVMNMPSPQM